MKFIIKIHGFFSMVMMDEDLPTYTQGSRQIPEKKTVFRCCDENKGDYMVS